MKRPAFYLIILLIGVLSMMSFPRYFTSIPFKATATNNVMLLKAWLFLGGNPNADYPGTGSLLYVATGPNGGYGVAKALLEAGADPNQGSGLYTPLMNAASWVSLDLVQLLLAHKADPDLRNEKGQKAVDVIGRASANGETEHQIRQALEAASKR